MQSSSEVLLNLFIIFFFIILFPAIWIGVLFLASKFSGWNKLSKLYKFNGTNKIPDKKKTFQSAQIGISNYNGILTLSYYPEGLGMEVMVLFRVNHPKLLIPWKDIKLKEKSKSIFSWNKLEIGNPSIATISVNNKVLEEINPYIEKKNSSDDDRW